MVVAEGDPAVRSENESVVWQSRTPATKAQRTRRIRAVRPSAGSSKAFIGYDLLRPSEDKTQSGLDQSREVAIVGAINLAGAGIRSASISHVGDARAGGAQVIVVGKIEEVHLELQPVRLAFRQVKALHNTQIPPSGPGTKDRERRGVAIGPRLRGKEGTRVEPLDAINSIM